MLTPFIDLGLQYRSLKERIDTNIEKVLNHGQFIMGPEVKTLESALESYTEAKNCVTVSSGTDALLISLMALGVSDGDEVITTAFTYIATVEVVLRLGAVPVLVDIDPRTCNIDATAIEGVITEKTKAIIAVSLYGQTADMARINRIASDNGNIPVIEDAAQSFGATFNETKSTNLSTIGCTSFFPAKPLGCYGDGGAIFTNDDGLTEILRQIRVHGQTKRYNHARVGVAGRMDTIQCAIVLAKLEVFDWEVKRRQEIAAVYNQAFAELNIETVAQINGARSVYGQYTIFTDKRQKVIERLKKAGIPTAVHYPLSITNQPAYKHLCCAECTPNASLRAETVLSLPLFPYMSEEQYLAVVENVGRAVD